MTTFSRNKGKPTKTVVLPIKGGNTLKSDNTFHCLSCRKMSNLSAGRNGNWYKILAKRL